MQLGTIDMATVKIESTKDKVGHMIVFIQLNCLVSIFIGKTFADLTAFPELATPFVKIRKKKSCISSGVMRVDPKCALEIAARFFVGLYRPLAQFFEATQPTIVRGKLRDRFFRAALRVAESMCFDKAEVTFSLMRS